MTCIICHESISLFDKLFNGYIARTDAPFAVHNACIKFYVAELIIQGKLPDPDSAAEEAAPVEKEGREGRGYFQVCLGDCDAEGKHAASGRRLAVRKG